MTMLLFENAHFSTCLRLISIRAGPPNAMESRRVGPPLTLASHIVMRRFPPPDHTHDQAPNSVNIGPFVGITLSQFLILNQTEEKIFIIGLVMVVNHDLDRVELTSAFHTRIVLSSADVQTVLPHTNIASTLPVCPPRIVCVLPV